MQEKLDLFEGRDVQVSELRLLGSAHERVGQLDYGEEVLIVAKAVVTKVEYRDKRTEQGGEPSFVRTHRAGITQFFVVPREQGERWLGEARTLADERFGVQDLLSWADREGQASEGEGGADGD